MSTVMVQAVAWEYGWELHVDGYGVTQVAEFADAEQQVRDFLSTLEGPELSPIDVVIHSSLHQERGPHAP